AAGIIGSVSVLKGQSLIGDAVGHATFPGVVLAFMLTGVMETSILIIGAVSLGIIAFLLINMMTERSKISLDSALAIVLSGFFGLGMALKSYIQGNPNFNSTQGIDDFIFGQAAYILKSDVYLISLVSVISLILFLIFYQHIIIYVFDLFYFSILVFYVKLILILFYHLTIHIID